MDNIEDTINRWVYMLEGEIKMGAENGRGADQIRNWLYGAAQVVLFMGRHDLYDKAMEAYRT